MDYVRFGPHVDDACKTKAGRTGATVLLYLNGDGGGGGGGGERPLPPLAGGETVFYRGRYGAVKGVACEWAPAAGSALVHRHGARCLLHEARAVTAGAKYVLRTDIVYAAAPR